MENALQRLENMTLEETRMTSAEALKAIHGVEGVLQDVTDLLHGVHDQVKDIGDKVIEGAQIIQLAMSTVLIVSQVTRSPDNRQKMCSVKEQLMSKRVPTSDPKPLPVMVCNFLTNYSLYAKHVVCLGLILRRASDFGNLWPIRKFTADSEVYVISLMCSFFFF